MKIPKEGGATAKLQNHCQNKNRQRARIGTKMGMIKLWWIMCLLNLSLRTSRAAQPTTEETNSSTISIVTTHPPQAQMTTLSTTTLSQLPPEVVPPENNATQQDPAADAQSATESGRSGTLSNVEGVLGGAAILPCNCRKEEGSLCRRTAEWEDNTGNILALAGRTHTDNVLLLNTYRRFEVLGDCALLLTKIGIDDFGYYTCTCLKRGARKADRTGGHKTVDSINFVTLMEKKEIAKQHPYSPGAECVKDEEAVAMNNVALPVTTIGNSFETQSAASGTLMSEIEAVEPTPDVPENVNEALAESNWSPAEVQAHLHAMARREAAWKAYGFDASALPGVDEWAGRNMWYQLMVHSIKSSKAVSGPCLVRVKSPSTLKAVFQTIPVPVSDNCQLRLLLWLVYEQSWKAPETDAQVRKIFKPTGECAWISELPYLDLLAVHEDIQVAVPESIDVPSVKVPTCFCSNVTHGGPGVPMGVADCDYYSMQFPGEAWGQRGAVHPVTFALPDSYQAITVMVANRTVPGNTTVGNLRDIWWVCGTRAYLFLPYGWMGCCYSATLKLPFEVLAIRKGHKPEEKAFREVPSRAKREMAAFHTTDAYHWRISLGEKWGLGIFPWYGVTFLADHIDNITYTLQG
ncbi:uncharacterized protein LOC133148325, partial [Syngnathus typhle]